MESVERLQLGAMGMADGLVDAGLVAPRLEFADALLNARTIGDAEYCTVPYLEQNNWGIV